MVQNTRVNTFLGNQLDTKDEKATCFYGCGPALVTGTSLGRLQVLNFQKHSFYAVNTVHTANF